MSFELPDLDTVQAPQLLAELVRRIPHYTARWTDHNDSDPGITLLQMLTWVSEALVYQANAVPPEAYRNMLRWVLGLYDAANATSYSAVAKTQGDAAFLALQQTVAQMTPGAAFDHDAIQRAVLGFRKHPYLALTVPDLETLALETNAVIDAQHNARRQNNDPPPHVKRAYARSAADAAQLFVLSDARWTYAARTDPTQKPGMVCRVVVYSGSNQTADKEQELLQQVRTYLRPRTLLGNQVATNMAQLTPVNLRCTVSCLPRERIDAIADELLKTLFAYFQPVRDDGAPDWPYDVAPDEIALHQQAFSVRGIDAIVELDLSFAATTELGPLAKLGVNTMLGEFPGGAPAPIFRGLPRLRYLEVVAQEAQS